MAYHNTFISGSYSLLAAIGYFLWFFPAQILMSSLSRTKAEEGIYHTYGRGKRSRELVESIPFTQHMDYIPLANVCHMTKQGGE